MKKVLTLCSALAILSLCSCSVNINNIGNGETLDCIKKDSKTQTVDLKDIDRIEIDISVGDCKIIVGDSAEASINADCEYKAVSEKKAQKAMKNTELRCETKGSTLYIDFIDSETGKEIGDINLNLVNIITDIKVTLPDSFRSFDISTDVGDIDVSGFSGAFDISSDVGDITAKNLTVTDESDFSADVGSIECEISELSANKLEITADIGDIDLSLGKTGKSKINMESDVGDIKLDTQGKNYEETFSKKDTVEQEKKIVVDGKCTVEMKSDCGNIKISK